MEKRTREKVALIVFAFLVAFAGIVLISYFSTGRSWTIAATFVDDTVGGLDGYTAIVYSGVAEPEPRGDEKGRTDHRPSQDDEYIIAEYAHLRDISSQEEEILFDQESTVESMMNLNNSIGLRILSIYPRKIHGEYDGVFVSDVRDLYERKGANAVTLSLESLDKYSDPTVLSSGGKRIGVFSIDRYTNRLTLRKIVAALELEGVDSIVCITSRLSLLSSLDGIDVVICREPIEEGLNSVPGSDDVLIVDSPAKGDVGVILLSTNNIASTRTIDVL